MNIASQVDKASSLLDFATGFAEHRRMHDSQSPVPATSLRNSLYRAVALLAFAALALLAFWGYQQPELLLDAVNLHFCN
jgi:hypothetical protein